MCQLPNIWYIWHTNHKNHPSLALPNLKKFETQLQYCLKYETVRTQMPFPKNNFLFNIFSLLSIFNSMFSLSCHCFLSLSTSLALSVLVAPSVLATPISPSLISPRRETETAQLATDHDSLCDEEELQCEGHGGRKWNFHQWRRRRRFGMWVCLIWWMGCCLLNFIIDSVDLACGFDWFGGCGFVWFGLSGCVFFFFFEVALVDVRQWLLVAVVAAWWLGRCWWW